MGPTSRLSVAAAIGLLAACGGGASPPEGRGDGTSPTREAILACLRGTGLPVNADSAGVLSGERAIGVGGAGSGSSALVVVFDSEETARSETESSFWSSGMAEARGNVFVYFGPPATAGERGAVDACVPAGRSGGSESPVGGSQPPPTAGTTAPLSPSAGCDRSGEARMDKKTYDAPPAMTIDTAKTYTATMETTCGTMKLRLFATEAPKTVNNFVFLARAGFYDGTIFHRVIPEFMIQGGDPQGTGRGGPGYRFEDENTGRQFDKPGLLAIANSGPGTNGSQFFITQVVINHLNAKGKCPGPQGCHSIFGELTEGTDVLERIIAVPKAAGDKPQTDVVITTVTIAES